METKSSCLSWILANIYVLYIIYCVYWHFSTWNICISPSKNNKQWNWGRAVSFCISSVKRWIRLTPKKMVSVWHSNFVTWIQSKGTAKFNIFIFFLQKKTLETNLRHSKQSNQKHKKQLDCPSNEKEILIENLKFAERNTNPKSPSNLLFIDGIHRLRKYAV